MISVVRLPPTSCKTMLCVLRKCDFIKLGRIFGELNHFNVKISSKMNPCCAPTAEWKITNVITYFKGRTFASLIVNCLTKHFSRASLERSREYYLNKTLACSYHSKSSNHLFLKIANLAKCHRKSLDNLLHEKCLKGKCKILLKDKRKIAAIFPV